MVVTVGPAVRVAVLVPFYGDSAQLLACLSSLVAQTDPVWRAIVVDDAAPDRRASEVVAALADDRIELVGHDRNRGLAAARNTAARHSDATWLLPLDADDLLPPDAITRLKGATDGEVDCCFGDIEVFGATRGVWRYGVRDVEALTEAQWLPGAGALFRRSVWERAGGWCEAPVFRAGNEDWDFWLAVAASGPLRARHVDAVTYRYRRAATSMSATWLRLGDGATRLAMVARHPTLFADPSRAARFVRAGMGKSVWAALRSGAMREAWQAARGWWSWQIDPHRAQAALLAEPGWRRDRAAVPPEGA